MTDVMVSVLLPCRGTAKRAAALKALIDLRKRYRGGTTIGNCSLPTVGGWWFPPTATDVAGSSDIQEEFARPEFDTHVLVQIVDSVDDLDDACEGLREEIVQILNRAYRCPSASQFSYSLTFQQVRADFPRGRRKDLDDR